MSDIAYALRSLRTWDYLAVDSRSIYFIYIQIQIQIQVNDLNRF